MKKLIASLALLAASGMAVAQTGSAPQQPPAGTAATPAPAAAQATPPAGKHQPQAKTQEEFNAYQESTKKPDAASMEQAVNAFAQQYPQSELRAAAYQNLMLQYQNANNGDKTVEIGRKTLALDADNPVALVTVASVLANRTRESDLDKEERINEAVKNSNRAIELLNSGEGVPAGIPAANLDAYKNTILSMAYAALGQANFVNNNFPAAEVALKKSVDLPGVQPDPISWFQYSLTLDREQKYADAQTAAEKCISVAQGHPVAPFCEKERDHAKASAANPPAKPAAK